MQNICASDWDKLFGNLSQKIFGEERRLEFALSKPADAAKAIEVSVNDAKVEAQNYTYDADRNTIVFTSANAPKGGEKVTITYWPK